MAGPLGWLLALALVVHAAIRLDAVARLYLPAEHPGRHRHPEDLRAHRGWGRAARQACWTEAMLRSARRERQALAFASYRPNLRSVRRAHLRRLP